jgi:hypothetical protein
MTKPRPRRGATTPEHAAIRKAGRDRWYSWYDLHVASVGRSYDWLSDNAEKRRAIPADRVTILFLVMLVAAAGNTAMQSALPAIASELDIADVWVSLAFSWSALLWVLMTAPKWARLSDKRGRKALMTVGVIGFAASMGLCGLVLWLGLEGYIGPARPSSSSPYSAAFMAVSALPRRQPCRPISPRGQSARSAPRRCHCSPLPLALAP